MVKHYNPKIFLERVGEGKTVTPYRAGSVIMEQGASADQVFYLQSGKAKETVRSDHGKVAVVGVLEPGMFFGTSAADGGTIRVSTVTAVTPCIVTAITKEAMHDALKLPKFAQLFMAYLLELNSRIEAEKVDLLFNSSERRLAQRLLLLAHIGQGRSPTVIGPEITQEMLADMIGTTRPRVNLFLNKFRKLGLIQYDGNLDHGITVLPALLQMVLQDQEHPNKGRES